MLRNRLRARPARGGSPIPARPRLLPATRLGKAALLLLLLVTLCRSLLFASAQPTLLAPDEDYHFHYVNYLVTEHALPKVAGDFATAESYAMAEKTLLGQFLQRPISERPGRDHAVVGELGDQGWAARLPAAPGTRNVLHAPGYHIGAAVVDRAFVHSSPVTRLTLMRYYSAVLGAIGVYFAWLLAAQLLARTWQQLAAAALVAFQPIAAFSASTMTNDVLVLTGITATLAWCAFLLRSPPRAAQGLGLGLACTLALYAKSTALSMVPIVALTLLLLWLANRDRLREVLRIAAWGAGIPLVLVGWWYVYVRLQTGSLLGGSGGIAPSAQNETIHSIGYVPHAIYVWFDNVYPGYWFNYLGYEVTARDVWYYIPLVVGVVGIVGLLWRLVELRRALFNGREPELRQLLILLLTPLVLLLPPLYLDVQRELKGIPLQLNQARFLVPAFPAVAVLMIVGLRQLTGRIRHAFPIATGVLVVLAAVFYWRDFFRWTLERYYGSLDQGLSTLLDNVGWLKPEWVGPFFLTTLLVIAGVAMVAAFALAIVDARRTAPRPAVERSPVIDVT
jgi:4-amino-4-deoxy-L-arabinose transferase-like glycosyltransferase